MLKRRLFKLMIDNYDKNLRHLSHDKIIINCGATKDNNKYTFNGIIFKINKKNINHYTFRILSKFKDIHRLKTMLKERNLINHRMFKKQLIHYYKVLKILFYDLYRYIIGNIVILQ